MQKIQKYKNILFYVGVTGVSFVLMYWIVVVGKTLEEGRNVVPPSSDKTHWQEFLDALVHNLEHPLAILLAQIVTIILTARFFGWLFKKIGQPTVIGEIIAGIVLGPSLVGMYFPSFSSLLFPSASLGNLQFLSQIGLILFMFVIGMELDLKVLRNKAQDAVVISHASIVIPFTLGMALAYFIYPSFSPRGVQFSSFALFLGISMSITAFPVLARIVQERNLHKTRLGTVVITCAAADDVTAWCLLAVVIAIVKAGAFVSALYAIILASAYVLVMIKIVRPFLKRVGDLHNSAEHLSKPIVAIFFLTLIFSAYATEVIGIHALFGAFMAGAIMPEDVKFRNIFIEKVEDVALVLLLPLFFVFTGLRTQIGLLNEVHLWQITLIIIAVAVTGKFAGSAFAAKFVGQSWKDSLTIGALMNTRGLMELVVLNIGYDLGVLTPEIFAMMVIMALATTFMTGPALNLIQRFFREKKIEISLEEPSERPHFKVLISFGHPERGRTLLRLAYSLIRKLNGDVTITAMHLSPANELNQFNAEQYERESFAPIINESEKLNQKIVTLFKPSSDIEADIAEVANQGNYDLLLVGVGQSIFEGSLLGKILGFTTSVVNPENLIQHVTRKSISIFDQRTRAILSKSKVPVGVLIDKGFQQAEKVLIVLESTTDLLLKGFVQKFVNSGTSQITILSLKAELKSSTELNEKIDKNIVPQIHWVTENEINKEVLATFGLMLVGTATWRRLLENKTFWLPNIPSTLIIKS